MSLRVQGDPQQSLNFLSWLRPKGPWSLTAIPVEGGLTQTATFTEANEEALLSWVRERDARLNLYFMVNPPRGPLTSKAKKEDVEAMEFLHVDLDPRKPGPEIRDLEGWVTTERARILALLQGFSPPPSAIIDSGGGYQAFWRLDEAINIMGDLALAVEAEAYNQQLGIVLGGDNTQNCDRIMRLPGTVNVPDRKKREKGRTERVASVVYLGPEDDTYNLSAFTAAPGVRGAGGSSKVQIPSNLVFLKDLDELGDKVSNRTKTLIVLGDDPDKPYNSRSEAVFAVVCALVRAGCGDNIIASILLDPNFGISESVIEKGGRPKAAREIQRARETVAEDVSAVPQFSEEALALEYAKRHLEDTRYVAPWSRWMLWDGVRWTHDATLRGYSRARAICREAAAEAQRQLDDAQASR